MNRRMFMTVLGFSGAAAGGAKAGPARVGRAPAIRSYVTNVDDVFGPQPLALAKGAPLRLWPDPARAYDQNTVVVGTTDRQPIGYLPRIQGQLIGPLLAAGFIATAEVTDIRGSPRRALHIAISLSAG